MDQPPERAREHTFVVEEKNIFAGSLGLLALYTGWFCWFGLIRSVKFLLYVCSLISNEVLIKSFILLNRNNYFVRSYIMQNMILNIEFRGMLKQTMSNANDFNGKIVVYV